MGGASSEGAVMYTSVGFEEAVKIEAYIDDQDTPMCWSRPIC